MTAQQMIVVDHLARLDDGSVVVAGIDGNHEHIAPLRDTPWDTGATSRGGGPFDIGGTVDIGFSRRSGKPPLVEEREIEEASLSALGRLPDGEFRSLLEILGHDHLPSIYGPDLQVTQSGAASVPGGRGKASLGGCGARGPPG